VVPKESQDMLVLIVRLPLSRMRDASLGQTKSTVLYRERRSSRHTIYKDARQWKLRTDLLADLFEPSIRIILGYKESEWL
jgi:hypothetical protein